MKVSFDERELAGALISGQIEINHKPMLEKETLENRKVMLVVVDMVKGFCETGALSSPRCKKIAPEIAKICELLHDADRIFVRDSHTENSAEFGYFPPHCVLEESELIDELAAYGGTQVLKNSTNAFVKLLSARSSLLDYDEIIVTGVCTDICVMQLALTLRAYISEFNGKGSVSVLTDAVETYDSPTHNADLYNMTALKLMEQSGVRLYKNIAVKTENSQTAE